MWVIKRLNGLRTLSTAKIFAHMKTKRGLSSLAELCNSFNTYGKIPTERACREESERKSESEKKKTRMMQGS